MSPRQALVNYDDGLASFPDRIVASWSGWAVSAVVPDRLSGWRVWYTSLYSDNPALFTLLTVVTVPVLALAIGWVTGRILARTGIDLKSGRQSED